MTSIPLRKLGIGLLRLMSFVCHCLASIFFKSSKWLNRRRASQEAKLIMEELEES